jgi:hypothetical protein
LRWTSWWKTAVSGVAPESALRNYVTNDLVAFGFGLSEIPTDVLLVFGTRSQYWGLDCASSFRIDYDRINILLQMCDAP